MDNNIITRLFVSRNEFLKHNGGFPKYIKMTCEFFKEVSDNKFFHEIAGVSDITNPYIYEKELLGCRIILDNSVKEGFVFLLKEDQLATLDIIQKGFKKHFNVDFIFQNDSVAYLGYYSFDVFKFEEFLIHFCKYEEAESLKAFVARRYSLEAVDFIEDLFKLGNTVKIEGGILDLAKPDKS